MPRDKDRKRIIRERMKKTSESYTAARARIIARKPPKTPAPAPVDYAALAGMSDRAIAARTGRTWQQWMRALDADHAAAKPHREIAALVHEKHGVGDWWAQAVTVGYERMKGLRERGQRRGGAYETNKSRTLNVSVDALFEAWADRGTRRRWLHDADPKVRTASAPKSMRLSWTDGTIVSLWFTAKGPHKSAVAVQHTKLPDKAAAERLKRYWTERLDALASELEASAER